ncbi:aminotransferase class V-fold PLP-dependent enzyme [Alienimonas californiensis]|uniref:cysteine desulfurase n=1 Tax=Alienimonas californiensis TaxID=2527989 RepID=A0A517PBQ5_9PLAN|nr:aminotransferase class V-fold PLP-dependent enzyme [Alienimonas californiensis]QDT16786.1 Cysteine desulfurase [Alienimonas californiensis]
MPEHPVYLDCNATTPLLPAARDAMLEWLDPARPANPGSRTHGYGAAAAKAVQRAREQVAAAAGLPASGVIFTSGATEANNLALLGLAASDAAVKRKHIVSTGIEHHAVLEPLESLAARGFDVTFVQPEASGRVDPSRILDEVRDDTLLVSVMHVNNETGVIQPIEAIADGLGDRPVFLHVDAAQGFCKDPEPLRHDRVDLIAVSGHKLGGPMGIGALLMKKRRFRPPPLVAVQLGGGQERGLRPGTLPTALLVGFGAAAEAAASGTQEWRVACERYRRGILEGLAALPHGVDFNTDPDTALPNCVNVSIRDGADGWLDGEAVLLAWKGLLAASNGSACTSAGTEPSHVLRAHDLSEARVRGAVRLSWCERTPALNWQAVGQAAARLI